MMTLDVIVAGIAHSLTDLVTCRLIEQDGIGMPPLHRITERGPQQHGESDMGFRLDPRIVTLVLGLDSDGIDPTVMLGKRDSIMSWFKARDTALQLRWTRDDAQVRQLDCHYVAQLGLSTKAASRYWLKVPAQFKAHDPTFYDPALVAVVFAIAAGADEMVIPLPIPWPIGVSVLDVTEPVAYVGTWRTYPVITVSGPVDDCVITNLATSEKLDFTGLSLAVGKQRIIDLRYARKTVVDETGADAYADLTSDSDAATWHLAEDPDALGGINPIHVTGTAVAASTAVTMQFYTRYISL
jgi:hypothetical protein